jgi:hypothetical protein
MVQGGCAHAVGHPFHGHSAGLSERSDAGAVLFVATKVPSGSAKEEWWLAGADFF